MIYRGGFRLIRGGLGQRGAVPTGAGLPATTVSSLPARGAIYQTVVPQRVGGGLTTTLPARLPSVGTTPPTTTTPTPPTTTAPTCPIGSYWNSATNVCVTPGAQLYSPGGTITPNCPTGMTWDPTSGCVTATTTRSYLPWILGGAAIVVLIVLMAKRR